MEISFFLNSTDKSENLTDSGDEIYSKTLFKQLINKTSNTDIYSDNQNNNSAEPTPLPKPQDALNAIQTLIAYIEGQDGSKTSHLRSLKRVERDLEGEIITARAQGTLDIWLSNTWIVNLNFILAITSDRRYFLMGWLIAAKRGRTVIAMHISWFLLSYDSFISSHVADLYIVTEQHRHSKGHLMLAG